MRLPQFVVVNRSMLPDLLATPGEARAVNDKSADLVDLRSVLVGLVLCVAS
jgi:hypothetical protein